MKRLLVFSSLIFTIILFIPKVSFAQDITPIPFDEIDMHSHCFILSMLIDTPEFERRKGKPFLEEKLLIDDQSSYEEFQKTASTARNMACKEVVFPSIDFSKKTLLGNWASGSCAAYGFKKKVFENAKKKEIIYSVEVLSKYSSCRGPGLEGINLITIPKVPNGYQVKFEPAEDHSGYQIYSFENSKTVARDWYGNVVNPRTNPPHGGGAFGVKMGVQPKDLSLEVRELMVENGAINIPLPELESKERSGQHLSDREKMLIKKLRDAQALRSR